MIALTLVGFWKRKGRKEAAIEAPRLTASSISFLFSFTGCKIKSRLKNKICTEKDKKGYNYRIPCTSNHLNVGGYALTCSQGFFAFIFIFFDWLRVNASFNTQGTQRLKINALTRWRVATSHRTYVLWNTLHRDNTQGTLRLKINALTRWRVAT